MGPVASGPSGGSISRHRVQHSIPKRIIQTGKNAHQPLRNRAAIKSIRLLNPDYEYLFFDNAQVEEFVDNEFPQYREVFDSFPYPIQRYDFFRYLAVYRYGGWLKCQKVIPGSLLTAGTNELLIGTPGHPAPVALRAIEVQLKYTPDATSP